jgi:hypothetical protein
VGLKQSETGQNEEQQGKKNKIERNKAKQIETNQEKPKKVWKQWVG